MWLTANKRFVWHVCLRNPFLPFLFGIPSIHSLPEAWGPWEQQHAWPALHYCIMPIPSLQLQKNLSHAEKQRVRSRSCGPKNCYNILIVLPCDYCSGEVSLSAADVHKMWHTAERRFVGHVCFRNPFLPFLFRILSIHSLPEVQGSWARQHAPTALRYGCIMPIPLLQLQKNLSHAEKQRVRSRSCGPKNCHNILIVLPCDYCSGEVSLSAADVHKMWHTAERRFVGHVCFRNPFLPFLFRILSIHSLPEAQGSWERQHAPTALRYGCIMPIPLLQLK